MKKMLRLILCGAMAAILIAAGFLVPILLERRWNGHTQAEPYTLRTGAVEFNPSADGMIVLLNALANGVDPGSAVELEAGYQYTDMTLAYEHARDLTTGFLERCGFWETYAYYDKGSPKPDSCICFLYLYPDDQGRAHSAVIWEIGIYFEDSDYFATVLFDDTTGNLIAIDVPILGGDDYSMKDPEWADHASAAAQEAYCELAGVPLQYDMEPQAIDPEAENAMYDGEVEGLYLYTDFAVGSASGVTVPIHELMHYTHWQLHTTDYWVTRLEISPSIF